MKVQLVNPCMNQSYEVNSRNGVMHPLGLLSLATYVRERTSVRDIEILDGSLRSREEINSQIGADIVGCTTGILSYEHAVEIAEIAKTRGARVVFGGPLADELPHEILENRSLVDWVVVGDGEEALADLIAGKPPNEIPNVGWRAGNSIVLNDRKMLELDTLPCPDRSFVDVEEYFRNYAKINVAQAFFRPVTFYSGKGCCHARRHGRCIFCARMDKGYRMRHPESVWAELKDLTEKWGADAFWDVTDSAVNDKDWMSRFEDLRPDGFLPKLVFYGRPDAITSALARRLRKLNCHLVFVGFESGSDTVLKRAGIGKDVNQAREAARILADNGIRIMGSLILGLPGETNETVQETVEFAQWLRELGNLETVSASVLMPLPGSQVFRLLCSSYPEKYQGVDTFDFEEARSDWLRAYTSVDLETLYDALPTLLEAGQVASSLGRPQQVASARNRDG